MAGARGSLASRVAAALALIAWVVAVVLTIVVVLLNIGVLTVVFLVTFPTGVIGGWYFLSSRGLRRWLGVAVLVVGLVFAVVSLVRTDLWADLGVLLALALVSVASARLALGRRSTWRAVQKVGPAAHAVAFLNAKSGGGKVAKFGLIEAAAARGVETVMIEPGLDLKAAAEAAVSDGADALVAAGGDGTQALIAEVAGRHGVAFVCIPAGTFNNFGGDLGLDLRDPSTALAALDDADEVTVDLGRVNGRVFVNNVSFGLYPEIISDPRYRDDRVGAFLARLPQAFGPGSSSVDLTCELPDGSIIADPQIVLVSNNRYELARPWDFGRRARLDGGGLGVATLRMTGPTDVARLALVAQTGRGGFEGWRETAGIKARITSGRAAIDAGIDGELESLATPVELEIEPAALRVRLPGNRPGSRMKQRLDRDAFTSLVQVVAGRSS
jgi:diacylglycerol kinase family enzyme